MKWFKHDSDANMDGKLKKLRIRFGMEGYGLYWYCLEVITAKVDQFNLNFELDHDAEIIANDLGLHFDHIQEIMTYMVKLNLFENINGTITCLKLARRLDQSMTSNPGMRNLIKSLNNHGQIMTESSQNRTEQKRKEKRIGQKNHFDLFWSTYPKKVKRKKAVEIWKRKKLDEQAPRIIADIKNRLAKDGRWLDGFIPDPTTYLNGERWEDEVQAPRVNSDMNSKSQIMRVGSQRGLQPRPGESMEDYESRIRATR